MATKAKLQNPHLLAVNPFGKTRSTPKKRNSKPKTTKSTRGKKNPSTVRATRNPDIGNIIKKGGAAGVGALATTFVANLLPLPVNPLLNAAAKAGVGVALGYAAGMLNATKALSEFVMAGGVGVAAADALRFFAPKLRTIIVPSEPQAVAIKEGTQGQLNDVVVMDDGLMGDVVDSMPYNSEWAQ
ncbi:MAG TPA: hypothetical protein VGB07_36175 [Blastocatellia bacterium]